MIRVPFFLLFGFNKGALNQKGQKGTTQEPRSYAKRKAAQPSGLWSNIGALLNT